MSLFDALKYVFKRQALLKIFIISAIPVIIRWIISLILFWTDTSFNSIQSSIYSYVMLAFYVVFLAGYGYSILRHHWMEQDNVPPFELFHNLRRGLIVALAILIYAAPLALIIFSCVQFTLSSYMPDFENAMNSVRHASMMGRPAYLPQSQIEVVEYVRNMRILLAVIFVPIVSGVFYALIVGFIRFADEERIQPFKEFGSNLSRVISNFRTVISLFARQLVVYGVYHVSLYLIIQFRVLLIPEIYDNLILLNMMLFLTDLLVAIIETLLIICNFHLIAQFARESLIVMKRHQDDEVEVDKPVY